MPGPLEGIRILDLSAVISGPLATMLLADQGADVIKVEPLGVGDITRQGGLDRGGIAAMFASVNRAKRSIALDIRNPRGRDLVLRLAERSDVFVQNFRPGAVERLGISEPEVRRRNPDVVYCSISGFGEEGPYADQRVYDPIIQGLSGHIAVQRHNGNGTRDLVRTIVCDKSSAYTAAQAITAALFARDRGRGGQHVRISMLDASLAFFWCDGMMRHTLVGDGVRPGATPYELYRLTETADGHILLFSASDAEFRGLCRALERTDWLEDPRFQTLVARLANIGTILGLVQEECRKHTSRDLLARLAREEVPSGPVLELKEVFEDPQVVANGAIVEVDHPTAGRMRLARAPARFERTPNGAGGLPPLLGEHTEEILRDLGCGAEEIQSLRNEGVAG